MTAYREFLARKAAGFNPPEEPPGRCGRCAFHPPTQGHRDGCPDDKRRR
jgi:hypothetical protein